MNDRDSDRAEAIHQIAAVLADLPPLNGPAAVRDFTAEILSAVFPFAFISGFFCGRAGSVKGARSAAILIANP